MATGGSDKDAEVDDSVTNRTCAICLENFRRPKLLPCFHTFCQSCLQGVAGSSPTLSCPACRTPVLLGVKGVRGLQDNFYIESDSSASSHPQQRLCDVCTEDKEATYTCIQCQQKFCLPCRKNHDAFKGCYGHTVVSLLPEDTDGCQKGGALPQNLDDKPKQEMCPKHPDQRLLLCCKQCQADICIQCKLNQHDGHSSDDLVDVQAKAKTSVKDMLRDVTQQRQQISHLILALGDRRAKLQQQQQETERGCQERADTLHQWVNQSVDDMVTSLQMTTRELDQPLQDQVELLQNKDLVLQAQQEHVARVLKDDLNTDIVSLEAQLSSSLLHSTEFKQIEKELTADIPKLPVKHTSSALNQLQLREFVGVLQPVQPASFPVQPNSVTAGADSTNNQSPLKSPQDGSKNKPPTAKGQFKCGRRGERRKQRSITVDSSNSFPHVSSSAQPIPSPSLEENTLSTSSVNCRNLNDVAMTPPTQTTTNISLAVFNAHSLGATCKKKRSAVNDFILKKEIDILCVTETWFKERDDEQKLRDLAPAGYTTKSFPRSTTTCGGGIAFVITDKLLPYCSFESTFVFQHQTFELVHLKLSLPCSPVTNFFGIYRPAPSKKNKLTPSMFISEFPYFLKFANDLSGTLLLIGDFNFHFNKPTVGYTPKVLKILDTFGLQQSVNEITNKQGNTVDWVVYRDSDHLLKSSTVDNNLASDHYAVKCELDITRPAVPKT